MFAIVSSSPLRRSRLAQLTLPALATAMLSLAPAARAAEIVAQSYSGPTDTVAYPAGSAASGEDGLEDRVRALEKRLEQRAESEKKAQEAGTAVTGSDGYSLKGSDGNFQIRWKGGLQSDSRTYQEGADARVADSYLIRRVRPIVDVTAWKYFGLRIVPDFGGGTVALVDAFVDVAYVPALKVRVGKFIPPFGLERQQAFTDVPLVEQAHTTNLTPNRDVGIQFFGDLFQDRLSYALASYAGAPDGAAWDADNNSPKDVAVRLFTHPFRVGGPALLKGLGVGFAATYGAHNGDTVNGSNLAAYRSPGQQIFFRYAQNTPSTQAGTAVANGDKVRFSPQGYYYAGPFGILAEYVQSSEKVTRGGSSADLVHTAWQATASVVLTGETPGYRLLKPNRNFLDGRGGLGAIELTGGISQITFDSESFQGAAPYANPSQSAREAITYIAGINWYLSRNFRLSTNYDFTQYEGGAAGGGNRAEEKVILNRVTVTF